MNTAPLDDLVRRTREGDPAARERLLAEVLDPVHLVARLRLGDKLRRRPDSRETVRKVALEALEEFPKSKADGGTPAFLTWLHAAVEKRLKKLKPEPARARKGGGAATGAPAGGPATLGARMWDPAASLASPGSRLERPEDLLRLEEALLRLDPEERDVLVLERFEGCLPEEIARRLGSTDRVIRKVRARALLRLARELKSV